MDIFEIYVQRIYTAKHDNFITALSAHLVTFLKFAISCMLVDSNMTFNLHEVLADS